MKKLLLTLCSSAFYLAIQGQAGSLDLSFGTQGYVKTNFPGSVPTTYVSSAIQADGKIVVIGTANGVFAIARYNTNGTLDISFSGDGMMTVDFSAASDVAIQADGKIVVVGSASIGSSSSDVAVLRLNPDGSIDNSFSGDGRVQTDVAGFYDAGTAIEMQADGKIVVLATANFFPFRAQNLGVFRYHPDGTLDLSFSGDGIMRVSFSPADLAADMLIQPDGKIVVLGTMNLQNPTSFLNIVLARLNSDGSSDGSFGGALIDINIDFAGNVALQPDGKIIVTGSTGTFTERSGLLFRYNPDGSLDNSFSGDGKLLMDPSSGITGFGAVVIQPDGKIIGGTTVAGIGSSDFALLRFNPDGTPDNTFSGDGIVFTDFENGSDVLSNLNLWNNRIYAVGTTTIGEVQAGIVAAFLIIEGAGILTCPGNRVTNVEPGLCSAVINNIDPILTTPGTMVNYELTGATNWSGTGSVSGFFFLDGITNVTYRLTNDPTQSCSFTLDIRDNEFPQGTYPLLQNFCFNSSNNYSLPPLQPTDNCGIRSIEYEISGATTRRGGGNNASGFLSPGMNIIKWTVKDISFNTKVIVGVIQINPALTVAIPDAVSLGQGAKPNTVYIGYSPAAYITLQAEPSGGAGFYSTQWSDGFRATWNTVHPSVQTTYTVTVTDLAGCSASASKTVDVIDVRCGDQNSKVLVCQQNTSSPTTICVDFWNVPNYLMNGSMLGNCQEQILTKAKSPSSKNEDAKNGLLIYPNPSAREFRINLHTENMQVSELIIRDQIGRIVERIWIKPDQMMTVGSSYRPGIYFAEVSQGGKRFTAKLIKQ